jgi:hypothetical protein
LRKRFVRSFIQPHHRFLGTFSIGFYLLQCRAQRILRRNLIYYCICHNFLLSL